MAGDTSPEATTIKVEVEDRGNKIESVDGTSVFQTKTALLVSDCGREALPSQTFGALGITTTVKSLAQIHGNEVITGRGIQLKANTTNTAAIVIGGTSVTASATASAIDGIPLAAGDTLFIEITKLSSLYAHTTANTQYLHWIAY